MAPLSDDALSELIRNDPEAGWRAFLDQYTPLIVGLIRRTGVDGRDETMDMYVSICERLSANGFERLATHDPARGSFGGWLAVLVRNAAIDWIRSRKGRRRIFEAVRKLGTLDQRVFELYFWEERTPTEIAAAERQPLGDVLAALERVQSALTERHRSELMSMMLRSRKPEALDLTSVAERIADPRVDPETAVRVTQLSERFESTLRRLPAEDAAIVRLKFIEGLNNTQIENALGVPRITNSRVMNILQRLRAVLEAAGFDSRDLSVASDVSIDGGTP